MSITFDDFTYEEFVEACRAYGTFTPADWEIARMIADTPGPVRVYYMLMGRNRALDAAGVIHGDDAKRFYEATGLKPGDGL